MLIWDHSATVGSVLLRYGGFTIIGVAYWGPLSKGSYYYGVYVRGPLSS